MGLPANPVGSHLAQIKARVPGVFLGSTIHGVAQVVAAGMMVGPKAGDKATVVKLFSVVLLLPVVMLIALGYRHWSQQPDASVVAAPKPPLVPGFLVGFLVIVLLARSGSVPVEVPNMAQDLSRWCLVVAIGAAAVKTSLGELAQLGWQPVLMLVFKTLVIAALVLCALFWGRWGFWNATLSPTLHPPCRPSKRLDLLLKSHCPCFTAKSNGS